MINQNHISGNRLLKEKEMQNMFEFFKYIIKIHFKILKTVLDLFSLVS